MSVIAYGVVLSPSILFGIGKKGLSLQGIRKTTAN